MLLHSESISSSTGTTTTTTIPTGVDPNQHVSLSYSSSNNSSASGSVAGSGGGSSGINSLTNHELTTTTTSVAPQLTDKNSLDAIQQNIKEGWTVHTAKDGRLYYCNHITKTAGWLPPIENWRPDYDLPYGWERAVDLKGQYYYINHLNKTSTYEAPERYEYDDSPPKPRQVTLKRSPTLGFGFVAGSERPVIVRFVTDGGPSAKYLLPGDHILEVNGEDVKEAPRDHVIQLVRNCEDTVSLVVCQPHLCTTVGRKSTLLSAGKKAKLKSKPIRVRFAESVCVNGAPLFPPSAFSLGDICVPPMANVLKVFLENGQTKSFKYDSTTKVQDVMSSLQDKLCITAIEHFSLVVEHVKSLKRNKLTLLDPQETVARIAARPGAHKLRCLFRITFVPVTTPELAEKDLNALDYLFMQCCNDVVQERFAPELQPDVALRLAALHIHQHALANNISPSKLTVKTVEREFGLERFVPASLVDSMKHKELRRLIAHFLKLNSQMTGSTTKVLTQLQAKIHYLDIISGLPSYGAKCFSTNQRDGVERVLLVSPRFGLSQIIGIRSSVPQPICTIEELSKVSVTKIDEVSDAVAVYIAPDRLITFPMEDREASEFVIVLGGYYRLLTGKILSVDQEREIQIEDIPPPYLSQHTIIPAPWSYFPYPTEKRTYSMAFLMPPPYHSTKQILTSMKSNELCDRNMNSTIAANQNHISTLERLSNNRYTSDARQSDDVLRRVVEMQKMVENSEQYLNEHGDFTTTCNEFELRPNIHDPWRETSVDFESDCDSISSSKQSYNNTPPLGVLKHSDSLTLLSDSINSELNDIERDLNTVLSPLYDNNRVMTTPQQTLNNQHGTPKPERKVQGFSKIISDLQALGHDLSLSESDSESVYSPNSSPIHQNQVRQNNQRNRLNRHSFGLHSPDSNVFPVEQESTKLREYLAKLRENSSKENERGGDGGQQMYGYNMGDDSLIVNDPDLIDLTSIPPPQTPDELDALGTLPGPPTGFDDKQKQTNSDLEAFLKQVTIVPPTQKATPAVELTPEEILSFIIPPPPDLNDTENHTSDEHMYCNKSEVLSMSHNQNTFSQNNCSESTMMNEFRDTKTQNNLDYKLNGDGKQRNGNIIEYPSLDRKPFLCCGKSEKHKNAKNEEQNDTTDNGFLKPPPRRCMHSEVDPIPQRPPKNIDLQRRTKSPSPLPVQTTHLNGFSDYNDAVPPSLPPRENTPMSPPLLALPPKKPPLPNKPIIKSPIPVIKNNIDRTTPVRTATIGSPHLHKPASTYHDIERAFNFSKEDIEQTNNRCNGHIRSRSDCPPLFPNKLVNGVASTQQPVSMLFSPQLSRKPAPQIQQFTTPPMSPFLSHRNGSIVNVEGLLAKTDFAMAGLQVKLDQIANACTQAQQAGGGVDIDEQKFQSAREELTEKALQLVTSSKELVVAMSDPHLNSLPEHLTACLTAIRRITELGQVLTLHTSSPLQTRNIILKIHDVASSFRELACVKVGTTAVPGELALHAECLANVLATLLRSLRLFSP